MKPLHMPDILGKRHREGFVNPLHLMNQDLDDGAQVMYLHDLLHHIHHIES